MRLIPVGLALALAVLLASCSADPYAIHPQAQYVEEIVTGPHKIEKQKPRPQTAEYILYVGAPFPGGGLIYKAFHLEGIPVSEAVGNALMARKTRYTEVFSLLAKGAVGEGSDGALTPRVAPIELTQAEREIINAENADRELIVQAFIAGRQVPPYEAHTIRRVFAYVRYRLIPNGIWIEKEPGKWFVKGGKDVAARIMAGDAVPMDLPPAKVEEEDAASRIEAPIPAVRESDDREGLLLRPTEKPAAVEPSATAASADDDAVLVKPEERPARRRRVRGEPDAEIILPGEPAPKVEDTSTVVIEAPMPEIRNAPVEPVQAMEAVEATERREEEPPDVPEPGIRATEEPEVTAIPPAAAVAPAADTPAVTKESKKAKKKAAAEAKKKEEAAKKAEEAARKAEEEAKKAEEEAAARRPPPRRERKPRVEEPEVEEPAPTVR